MTKIAQLILEELINMHAKFIHVNGRSKNGLVPSWLNVSTLCTFPSILKDSTINKKMVGTSN